MTTPAVSVTIAAPAPAPAPAPALAHSAASAPPIPGMAERAALERSSGAARRSHAAVVAHLRTRNEQALVRTLADAADVLTPEERTMACWIPCLMGLEEANRAGRPFPCTAMVAHFIAVSARVALAQSRLRTPAPWLVGMTMIDQSAAHLVALLLVRRGISTRPWWAPDLPRRGPFLLVSTLAGEGLATGDSRCLGALSLAHEARCDALRVA